MGDNDSVNENDGLGQLIEPPAPNTMTSICGTIIPKASSFTSIAHRSKRGSPSAFPTSNSFEPASQRSFQTARSSLASYITAPSGPSSPWNNGPRGSREERIRVPKQYFLAPQNFAGVYEELLSGVVNLVMAHSNPASVGFFSQQEIKTIVGEQLSHFTNCRHERRTEVGLCIHRSTNDLLDRLVAYISSPDREILRNAIHNCFQLHLEANASIPGEVFSSAWLMFLNERGILLGSREELNWSGKGQHVEYHPEAREDAIPLKSEKILGYGQTAVIDRVKCRRIRLARKTIMCNRRLKKEDAVIEVEHLVKLQHAHIVRIVGTYTLRKDLAILVYPAAEWDLDKYMDELIEDAREEASCLQSRAKAIVTFFGCLSNAIAYIHGQNIKHMDIKPKNLLVRLVRADEYRIYVADFGIARYYKCAADSETDSPTSFTRAYAAPEVVHQDKRGFSADIFSLGCVFIELTATLFSCTDLCEDHDERQILLDLRKSDSGNPSFYANIDVVKIWYENMMNGKLDDTFDGKMFIVSRKAKDIIPKRSEAIFFIPKIVISREAGDIIPRMITESPDLRPSAPDLKEAMETHCCLRCDGGPEPFEAAT
ncbi:kinase-like domain-containing protein [Phaeosphaeriaceae sp. PMI808]|nr:kinase-like domain-containing protein [Phaeosphaeriaceae sp. PMI808]